MISCLSNSSQPPVAPSELGAEGWHHETVHTVAEIRPVCCRLAAVAVGSGYSSHEGFTLHLAVEEALINAIKHGHGGDTSKTVHVSYCVSRAEALVNVEDEGQGFDPDQVGDPLDPDNLDRSTGRGLLLMRHYMTWIQYNERGNGVTLCKRGTA